MKLALWKTPKTGFLATRPKSSSNEGADSPVPSFLALFYVIESSSIFQLVGGGTLGVGVWMLMDPNIETYFDILNVDNDNQDFKMICYILCSIGGSILVIGFLGCCGTIKSSKCMLTAVSHTCPKGHMRGSRFFRGGPILTCYLFFS